MKILQSSIFRALCACIVGILLISNPGYVAKGITIAIGNLEVTHRTEGTAAINHVVDFTAADSDVRVTLYLSSLGMAKYTLTATIDIAHRSTAEQHVTRIIAVR